MAIIIHSPQGSGKTRGAETLAAYFDCSPVIDGWNGETAIPANAMVFTNLDAIPVAQLADVRVMSLAEASRQVVGIAIAQPCVPVSSEH